MSNRLCCRLYSIILTGILVFASAFLPAETKSGPGRYIVQLGPDKPAFSSQWTPQSGGYLRVQLRETSDTGAITHAAIFRQSPGQPPRCLASGSIASGSETLFYAPMRPGHNFRCVVWTDAPQESPECLLTLAPVDDHASLLVSSDGPQSRITASWNGNRMASLPVAATGTMIFSPDGRTVMTASGDYQFYNTYTGDLRGTLSLSPGSGMPFFLPGGNRLLAADSSVRSVTLYTLDPWAPVAAFPGTRFTFTSDAASFIVTGGNRVLVSDLDGHQKAASSEAGGTTAAYLSPDGKSCAWWVTGTAEASPALLSIDSGREYPLTGNFSRVLKVRFSPAGDRAFWRLEEAGTGVERIVVQSTGDGSILIEDARSYPIDFQPDYLGKVLAVYPAQRVPFGSLTLYSLSDGAFLRAYPSFRQVDFLRFHPTSGRLLAGGSVRRNPLDEEAVVRLIQTSNGRQIQEYAHLEVYDADFNSPGSRFFIRALSAYIAGRKSGEIRLLDSRTGELIRDDFESDSIWYANDWSDAFFAGNGNCLVASSVGQLGSQGTVTRCNFWNSLDGVRLATHVFGQVLDVQSSPGGRYLAFLATFGVHPRVVRLIDTSSGQLWGEDFLLESASVTGFNSSGDHFLFAGTPSGQEEQEVFLAELAKGSRQQFSALDYERLNGAPGWSPDGHRFTLPVQNTDATAGIYLVHVLGSSARMDYIEDSACPLFDLTQRPVRPSLDLDGSGGVDYLDLFELHRQLDPEYPALLYTLLPEAH